MNQPKKAVFFDALHTLLRPRQSVAAQYARVFNLHFGPIQEAQVEVAFPRALKHLQIIRSAYAGGKDLWWADVVRKTAVASGADAHAVEKCLPEVMVELMNVFRTQEGYKLFDDVEYTLELLKSRNIRTGIVSNSDSRMREVLQSLGLFKYLDPIVLSEEEGIEKPAPEIWQKACQRIGMPCGPNILHVGDELEVDVYGATAAGLKSVLIRRSPNSDLQQDIVENSGVLIVKDLYDLLKLDFFKSQ